MARILGIGIATLDIINTVDGYPHEDAKVRAVTQRVCRGGNAANTLAVLSQLGHDCHFAGVVADDSAGQMILDDLSRQRINSSYCGHPSHGRTPTSYIAHNRHNGSRTIIHYRDLPEFSFSDFSSIPLQQFDWLHFEGRNVDDTRRMLEHAAQHCPRLPRSVEIEKNRPAIEQLFTLADVLIFSQHYVSAQGARDPQAFLGTMHQQAPHAELVCSWGEQGAWYHAHQGGAGFQPATPPATVVDTLAAGDTFNAALIDGLLKKYRLSEATAYGCRLAGQKCAVEGLDFIVTGRR